MAKTVAVLVVDDDAVSSAQLCALAKAAGYAPTAAADGREAWEMLQLSRFQVVISDWYMPEMDGLELCRRVRARRNQPYIYFIMVTSRRRKQQILTVMEAGADDVVPQP